LLLAQPIQETLEPGVGQDLLDRVERVSQFVMGPGFVNEILAGTAGGHDKPATLATRNHMMPSGGIARWQKAQPSFIANGFVCMTTSCSVFRHDNNQKVTIGTFLTLRGMAPCDA
jgi:hypothetical protein